MDYKILLEFKPKVNERGVFLRDAHYFVTKYPCINNDLNNGFIMRYFKLRTLHLSGVFDDVLYT